MISQYFTVAVLFALSVAPHAQNWQEISNCTILPNRWNDGDSFHVLTGDAHREIVARLYYIDTPEAETAYRDRLDEQAAYFGINRDQAIEIAHESANFTSQRLSKPFTVWTRWRKALGSSALGRVYCIIIDSNGKDLNESLVENGLARIYGTKTPLPDGRDSSVYVDRLKEIEAKAKLKKLGAWRFQVSKCRRGSPKADYFAIPCRCLPLYSITGSSFSLSLARM